MSAGTTVTHTCHICRLTRTTYSLLWCLSKYVRFYVSAHFQMLKSEKTPLSNNTTSKSSTLFFEAQTQHFPTRVIGIMAQKMIKTKIVFIKSGSVNVIIKQTD